MKRLLKRVKGRMGKIFAPAVDLFEWLGSKSRATAVLYYALMNWSYANEQRSYLYGKQLYRDALRTPDHNMPLLRRNVHRLEKGLLMKPRRVPFGLKYIKETVDAFERLVSSGQGDPCELAWATDVLGEYFAVCEEHDAVEPLRQRFQSLEQPKKTSQPTGCTPYKRDLSTPPSVKFDDLMELAKRRRSVRWFLPKPVPREMLDQAIVLATLAPSACNRQPFEFRILDDPDLVLAASGIPFGTAGYNHNIPTLAVLVGKYRNYFDERDRHLIYIDASLAAMGFVFAVETLGLSSCCINWPEIDSQNAEMAKLLKLKQDERPIMLIAIGYPDPEGMVAFSAKKSIENIRKYNLEHDHV